MDLSLHAKVCSDWQSNGPRAQVHYAFNPSARSPALAVNAGFASETSVIAGSKSSGTYQKDFCKLDSSTKTEVLLINKPFREVQASGAILVN